MLDPRTKRLLKETVALLPPDPKPLVLAFYDRLFELAPETRPMFPDNLERQAQKLTEMLVWIVEHLDKPDELLAELHQLGARHAGYGVQVDHYGNVGSALIWMFRQGLGDRFTNQMEEAWFGTYAFMSGEMERGQFSAASAK